jgi:hypothetical protein
VEKMIQSMAECFSLWLPDFSLTKQLSVSPGYSHSGFTSRLIGLLRPSNRFAIGWLAAGDCIIYCVLDGLIDFKVVCLADNLCHLA